MAINWLGLRRNKPDAATLQAIYIASTAGEPMMSVSDIEAIAKRGLKGDRYSEDRGHWKSIDGCQVTLITEHDLEQAKKTEVEFREALDNGSHRRNLVIAGLKTKHLEGKEFRIGSAVFRYDKPRPPCAYLDQIAGKGMCRALSHNSGVCIRVITGGTLAVGDAVEIMGD
ncbi:MAG: MOSC domain-containing protein [Sulfuricaulis sp.]|uniref:MOSC domain-containing protein n=1 Tax=Sulfuricaulis sp. TaxID=2003553 RepID=UPI0025D0FFFB|nr:MOSC domain-containing protein [Sulfuricaulis sp.]MCR4347696.1 MOSC domain-containing protein [Sulfuricaulis sp.]